MNPRRTPQRVGLRQSLNQPANLELDRRPPNSSRFTGQTSPVPAKTLPLPAASLKIRQFVYPRSTKLGITKPPPSKPLTGSTTSGGAAHIREIDTQRGALL